MKRRKKTALFVSLRFNHVHCLIVRPVFSQIEITSYFCLKKTALFVFLVHAYLGIAIFQHCFGCVIDRAIRAIFANVVTCLRHVSDHACSQGQIVRYQFKTICVELSSWTRDRTISFLFQCFKWQNIYLFYLSPPSSQTQAVLEKIWMKIQKSI